MAYRYDLIDVAIEGRIAWATVNNPPINLVTMDLAGQIAALSQELAADPQLTVVVLKSGVPDFFLAHFDVEAILGFPVEEPATRSEELSFYHAMCDRFRSMDKVTIAQMEGRAGGGGNELASCFDMRFGVRGRTTLCQMEVPLGILPGGCGTQSLPRLVGRNRAMEIVMAGDDIDAETAERWGYLNRVFAPDEIEPFVEGLARRIASFPPEAVRLCKQSVNNAAKPWHEGLVDEAYLFQQTLRTEGAQRNMRRFLELGGQTREGELRVGALGGEIAE